MPKGKSLYFINWIWIDDFIVLLLIKALFYLIWKSENKLLSMRLMNRHACYDDEYAVLVMDQFLKKD